DLRQKTQELAMRELSFENRKYASELVASYDIILKTLADIGQSLSDMSVSIDDFYTVLKTVFEKTEIGTIPTSIDEVTIGSAARLTSSDKKYVFVLGLCEGEFPATVTDTGLIKGNDRDILNEYGIELGENDEICSSKELMFIKNTFSSPTNKLFLFTYLSDSKGTTKTPSLPFRRTAKLFRDLTPHRFYGYELEYLSGTPRSVASHLRNITCEADRRAATLAVSHYLPLVSKLSTAETSTDVCRVSPDIVKGLIGDKVYISPSSLEKYVKCPFSYYAGHILSLRETKRVSFGANNIGDFVHYVMEHIIGFAITHNESKNEIPSDEEILKKIDEIVDEYIKIIVPDSALLTRRMQHLYKKLQRLSRLVAESVISEFSDSDFRPAFFEFHINGKEGNPEPLVLSLKNGARLVLKGYIDRVDIWKQNNKVYVRIVDYKTGSKQFDLSDLEVGLNTQMLLYLFAVCRNPGSTFIKKYNLDGAEVIPAGVTYLSSAFPKIKLNNFDNTDDQIFDKAQQELSRSGIILDEESVINAMSHSKSKDILLGIYQKNGKYVGKSLVSSKDFSNLYASISDTLVKIGENIYSGIADCTPMVGEDPCKYCNVYPMCRKNNF
ncbi:MAG: PD-(D/E)XK nuclease family protein, partial [Clostridia bacterium]|nr:PD-(D/E)XK nuclease family protein [Clostridia bacterium]